MYIYVYIYIYIYTHEYIYSGKAMWVMNRLQDGAFKLQADLKTTGNCIVEGTRLNQDRDDSVTLTYSLAAVNWP
jgi:hypothetical protein